MLFESDRTNIILKRMPIMKLTKVNLQNFKYNLISLIQINFLF